MPSGLNATALSQLVAPASVPARTASDPFLVTFLTVHSQTFRSWLAAASVRPFGLNATPNTGPPGPVSGMCGYSVAADGVTFHSAIVPSEVPAASTWPSALNATEFTCGLACGSDSGFPSGVACAGSATCQSRTVPSALPAASSAPSGLKAIE